MEMLARRRRGRLALLALTSIGLYGCTGGLSCGGDSGGCVNAYEYPQSSLSNGVQPVDDGARMRMTQAALDFLSEHLQDVLLASFPTAPGNPNLVQMDVGAMELFGSSYANAWIGKRPDGSLFPTNILIDSADLASRLTFQFVEGAARDGVRLEVVDLPIGIDARAYADWWGGGTAGCDIDGTWCPVDDPGCGLITTLTVELMIYPDVGAGAQCDLGVGECMLIDVEVADFALGGLSNEDLEITVPPFRDVSWPSSNGCSYGDAPPLCEPECSDAFVAQDADWECRQLCGAADFLVDIVLAISGALEGLLEPLIANMLEGAIRDALADFDGAPVSFSDKMDLAAMGGSLINATAHPLGVALGPTGDAFDVNCPTGVNCAQVKGMDFIFKSGAEAAPPDVDDADPVELPHPCVVPVTGARFASLYDGQGEFVAPDAAPLTGEYQGAPYHLGMSLARAGMNQALFGTYNAGVLCIELDSEAVHVLSGGAFPLSVGTLDFLTGGKLRQYAPPTAPALITFIPHEPPVLEYGAGDDTEGHVIASWNDVEISFYVWMNERFARLFAVKVDIAASITVYVDPADTSLRIAITDGPTINDYAETYNELLPGVAFDEALEDLVGVAFDSLLGDDLGFSYDITGALSDALGVPLYIDFRGLETAPAGDARDFLNVYLALTTTPPSPQAPRMPSSLRFAEDPQPGVHVVAGGARSRVSPKGELLLLGSDLALDDAHEIFAQVDFGTWRGPFRADDDGVVTVRDPKLSLIGEHTLRFQLRVRGAPLTLTPLDDELTLWVDPQAPWAELAVEGDHVVARGQDVGTLPADLLFSWREGDREWSEPAAERRRALDDVDDVRRLAVRAHDRAGNVSRPVSIDLGTARLLRERRSDVREGDSDLAPPYGCSASAPAPALAAFALVLLARFVRRREAKRDMRKP